MISKSMKYTSFALHRTCQTIVAPINEAWYNVIRHFSLEAENEHPWQPLCRRPKSTAKWATTTSACRPDS